MGTADDLQVTRRSMNRQDTLLMRMLSYGLITVLQVVLVLGVASFAIDKVAPDDTSQTPTGPQDVVPMMGQDAETERIITDTAGRFEEITKVLESLTR